MLDTSYKYTRLTEICVHCLGVEGVETDCKSHKVVVKGEKADRSQT